jgi:hypothetical protein
MRLFYFRISAIYIISLFGKYFVKDSTIVEENLIIFWSYEIKKYFAELDLTKVRLPM